MNAKICLTCYIQCLTTAKQASNNRPQAAVISSRRKIIQFLFKRITHYYANKQFLFFSFLFLGNEPLFEFLEFIILHRSPLFLLLLPIIRSKVCSLFVLEKIKSYRNLCILAGLGCILAFFNIGLIQCVIPLCSHTIVVRERSCLDTKMYVNVR